MSSPRAEPPLLALAGEETLWTEPAGRLAVVARDAPSDALVAQIAATRFGTHGLRYRRLDVESELERLRAPVFLELVGDAGLLGTYVLSTSELDAGGRAVDGLYRGLLTVREGAQGRRLGRVLVEQGLRWVGERAGRHDRPVLAYGCVERRNARSLRLLESLGCRDLGSVHALAAYRQWVRRGVQADRLGEGDGDALREGLAQSQGDCGLRPALPGGARFLAITDDARILAGASASVHRIDMGPLGGALGLAGELMRRVPAARRRFDPRSFAYLRLADVVVRPGHAHLWRELVSSLLAMHGVHTAMFFLDPRSRACALLREAGLFGLATRAMHQELAVLAAGWHLAEGSLDALALGPLGVAPQI